MIVKCIKIFLKKKKKKKCQYYLKHHKNLTEDKKIKDSRHHMKNKGQASLFSEISISSHVYTLVYEIKISKVFEFFIGFFGLSVK